MIPSHATHNTNVTMWRWSRCTHNTPRRCARPSLSAGNAQAHPQRPPAPPRCLTPAHHGDPTGLLSSSGFLPSPMTVPPALLLPARASATAHPTSTRPPVTTGTPAARRDLLYHAVPRKPPATPPRRTASAPGRRSTSSQPLRHRGDGHAKQHDRHAGRTPQPGCTAGAEGLRVPALPVLVDEVVARSAVA